MAKPPADIRSLARSHTASAVRTLAHVMANKKSPAAARVGAAEALLNRGWGKPTQMIAGDGENPIEMVMRWASPAEATPDPSEK